MTVNRIVLEGSAEEYARVVDDSSIEIVLRHDCERSPFFFSVEASFGLDHLAVRLLSVKPGDQIIVLGWLKEGSSAAASITIRALAVKSSNGTESPFDQLADPFDEFALGPDPDDEIPF